jgi:hypothetical protein
MATRRPAALSGRDFRGLVARQHARADVIDADAGGDGAGYRLGVAGQQHDGDAPPPERCHRLGGARPHSIGHRQYPQRARRCRELAGVEETQPAPGCAVKDRYR